MHYPVEHGYKCWLLTGFWETFICAPYQDIFVILLLLASTQSRHLFELTTFTHILYYIYIHIRTHPFHRLPFPHREGRSATLLPKIYQK